jgi:hypothetical protein
MPEPVNLLLEQMRRHPPSSEYRLAVLDRLMTDPRMRTVFDEFLRRDRQTGELLHRPRKRADNQSADSAHLEAVREVLERTITAAGDRLSVSRLDQIEAAQQRWGDLASRNRELAQDMELAAELGMMGLDEPTSRALGLQDLQGLRRVANWLDHLTTAVRRRGDPLIVKRHRGDPIARGVQIAISGKIDEQFGERLDGTAATLTSVALGVETSPRVSRSALAKPKPKKRRSAP